MKNYIRALSIHGECIVSTEGLRPTTLTDERFRGYLEDYIGRMYEVLRESDDINELVDTFVAVYDNNEHIVESKIWDIDEDYKHLYGAIWTPEGLKYAFEIDKYSGLIIYKNK